MKNQIECAQMFSIAAHSAIGQKRKFTNLPYQVHPQEVAEVLQTYVSNVDEDMIVAAYLHDVVEDTQVLLSTIVNLFGVEVGRLVKGLTNMSWPDPKPNRHDRHHLEVFRLSLTCPRTKTIKLADCYCNLKDIVLHDKKFAATYVPEKKILLDEALKEGDTTLWNMTDAIITSYLASNTSN